MRFLLLSLAAAASAAFGTEGRLPDPVLVKPALEMRDLVILFSDQGGIDAADQAAAAALGHAGVLVAEIDSKAYLARLAQDHEACQSLVRDIELLSRKLQHENPTQTYHAPILAGRGLGGALAEAALVQAPPATIAGALTLDPAQKIDGTAPLCDDALGFHPTVNGFWSTNFTATGPARDRIAGWQTKGMPVKIDTAETLDALASTHLADPPDPRGFYDLPLIQIDADQPSDLIAIVLSGDGGWRGRAPALADALHKAGIQVLGFDDLRYFWKAKSTHLAAEDVAAAIQFLMPKGSTTRIALIGDNFGANLLPFLFNRLPPDMTGHVVQMSLIDYVGKADFEITPQGWLGAPPSDKALPDAPELDALPAGILQCFAGSAAEQAACSALPKGAEILPLKEADDAALTAQIVDGFKRRAGR